MNKTQIRKHITKTFIAFVNANYPQYIIDEGEGGRLSIVNTNSNSCDDNIEYSRSYHDCCCYNWSYPETKTHTDEMNAYLSNLKREYGVAESPTRNTNIYLIHKF